MLAQGDEGHVVNTSSGNGGLAPLPSTPQYAVTKAAVVTFTECLYAQLRATTDLVGASVLFPGPHILRTGLFESWRTRPERFAKTRPRKTPYVTVEQLEEQMRAAGIEPDYTEPAEVAGRVVDALRTGDFWILPESDHADATIRSRADSMLARANPAYLDDVPGGKGAKGASR
jgi:NAD(P)-dependent dehydrogenase (short-subunit alcohol dehydrogenase family)